MGISETEAVVLRTYKLAEADKITVMLTRQAGIRRGVARGARRLKSKFGAALEPFTLINVAYFEKEGQELVSIQQAEIVRSYFEFSRHPEVVAAMEYLGGLVLEFAPPHEPNEKIFRMLCACLEAIALEPDSVRHITRYGEIWLLKLSGFLPDLNSCLNCERNFSAAQDESYLGTDGALRCGGCAGQMDVVISGEAGLKLRATQRLKPLDWGRASRDATTSAQRELSQFTQRLISRALERLPEGSSSVK